MLPATFVRGNDRRRLRRVLGALFLALAVPTAALIWQAFNQLKWEAWFQHRSQAEALTAVIDDQLAARVATADRRRFADFSFFSETGGRFAERSALAALPVPADVPGVIGYFQIDPDGRFSTPLLPDSAGSPDEFGLEAADWDRRTALARELRAILSDNELMRDRAESRLAQSPGLRPSAARTDLAQEELPAPGNVLDIESAESDAAARPPAGLSTARIESYSQQAFDELNQPLSSAPAVVAADAPATLDEAVREPARINIRGKVSDLGLDDALEKKSEALNRSGGSVADKDDGPRSVDNRERRLEQEVVPRQIQAPAAEVQVTAADADGAITTFESEIDPYEFSLLDSGHLVLFRKVWRDDKRYIQGMLLNTAAFSRATLAASFQATSLAGMSDLVLGYQGDIIDVIPGRSAYASSRAGELEGALLYRARLSAPLQSLELVYSIRDLPPGPGAALLGWTTLLITLVFTGGFIAMYRLGSSQIKLAQQQQDFVSAVSHELKTPLTSIRMYGEMLREGWADDDKRQQYYEYIHDESERLSRLISNVLQLARITRSDAQVEMQVLPVATLIDEVQSKIANQVERAGFRLTVDTGNVGACKINIDPDCFIQIVINLVDNAIKFSRDATQKEIVLSASHAEKDHIVLSIRDYGPGIPKNRLRKIFELFYRTESELTRETVGTGIGLAIVRQLSLAMNGQADVINRTPGAEFQVRFPLVPADDIRQ